MNWSVGDSGRQRINPYSSSIGTYNQDRYQSEIFRHNRNGESLGGRYYKAPIPLSLSFNNALFEDPF